MINIPFILYSATVAANIIVYGATTKDKNNVLKKMGYKRKPNRSVLGDTFDEKLGTVLGYSFLTFMPGVNFIAPIYILSHKHEIAKRSAIKNIIEGYVYKDKKVKTKTINNEIKEDKIEDKELSRREKQINNLKKYREYVLGTKYKSNSKVKTMKKAK